MISIFLTTAKYIIRLDEKLSKVCPATNVSIVSMADKICSNRPRSLIGSLIQQFFIMICS